MPVTLLIEYLSAEVAMNSCALLNGNVEMERSTVSGTSDKLISYNQLATLLRTLQVGYYGRVSKQRGRWNSTQALS